MRLKLAFAFLLMFITTGLTAQVWRGTARVQGVVTDVDGKPVKGATVSLVSERAGGTGPAAVKTDAKGKWAVGGVMSGAWEIEISAEGYGPRKTTVQLSEFERIPPVQTKLEPLTPAPPPPPAEPEPPREEIQIGGQTIAPEIAAAIEAGNRFMQDEKYKDAITEYEKAQAALPTNIQIKQALARAYYASKQRKPAIGLLRDVYSADPTNVQTGMLLANILIEDDQATEAKKIIDAIPAAGLTDSVAMTNIGILFLNKNKPADALKYLDRAINIDGKAGENFYYRALANIQLDKRSAARADLEKFIQLSPDAPEVAEAKELLKQLK
jgi:Tfp pilus assembly protein PilF